MPRSFRSDGPDSAIKAPLAAFLQVRRAAMASPAPWMFPDFGGHNAGFQVRRSARVGFAEPGFAVAITLQYSGELAARPNEFAAAQLEAVSLLQAASHTFWHFLNPGV